MSYLEWRLNRRFWRSKKVVQVVQIEGRGEVIWTKSKRTASFFSWNLPYQTTEKPICTSLPNGCSKQMMITWRHCNGRPTEVSPKSRCYFKTHNPSISSFEKLTPRSSSLSVSHIVGGGALGAGSNGQSFITSTILNHSQPFSTTRTDRPCRTLQVDAAGVLAIWWFSNFQFLHSYFFHLPLIQLLIVI